MMYVVVFFEEYVGHHFDEYSKVFMNKNEAEEYAKVLNIDFAEANMCSVEDLGDYYTVEEIAI